MKSAQGNINSNSSSLNAQNTLAKDLAGLDTKINFVRDYFLKHSLIQEIQEEKKDRISLLKLKKSSRQYGHIPAFVIDPCSSGEESDIEDEKMNEATIRDVANTLIDLNTIMIVKNIEEFPKEARPCLLLQNLDEWITPLHVKLFVEDSPCFMNDDNQPKIEEVKILKYKNLTFALVVFQKLADCVRLFKYFEHPNKKKLAPSKNSKGGLIEVYLSYDLLDLTLSYWYGVVLRNLPNNCTQGNVKTFCENQVNGLLYVLYPMKIKTSYCSIAIVKELDDAEKLSVAVNNKEVVKNKRIKAHVHPKSCKIRRDTDKSHFLKFFVNNKISFGKNAKESNLLVNSHTTLTKLKIFQTNQAKVESEKTNALRENQGTNAVINTLDKPHDNTKSAIGSGKLGWKNTEKQAGKEKDMHTSLLSMLSIPSKEKQEPVIQSSETNNTNLLSSSQTSSEDNFVDNSQFCLMKLPFLSNLNQAATGDNNIPGNIKETNEDCKSELMKAPLSNKEINITKTTRKATNSTIPLMSSIGEMLKLISKNQSQVKPNEIQGDSLSAVESVEKTIQKTQNEIEPNNNELLKEETVNKPSEENKVENSATTTENLNKNEIINLIDEPEEIYNNEYYQHDFKNKTFYEKPRMIISHHRLNINKPDYRQKINNTNEGDVRLETTDDSRFKKYNNSHVRMHNYNNNSDSTPKFNNFNNYPSQSNYKEKDLTNYNYQNNQSKFNQAYPYKNTNYNSKQLFTNNYPSSNTYQNNQNYRNLYNNKNSQDYYDTNSTSIRTINQSMKQGKDSDLNTSGNMGAININTNHQFSDKNLNQNANERGNNNLIVIDIDIAPSHAKQNILPPLPTTQPPEPEIRNLSALESVVVLEGNEEPGQIILSPTEEEKTKSEIRLLSSTNSEDNTDKKYVGKKRSRSRERTRDYHKDYKDRSNSRRSSHFRENNDRSSYVRKDNRRDSREYQNNREHNNQDRYRRESKDYNEKNYYTERNRNSKHHRTSSRSSSSDIRSPNDHHSGLYMTKFHERTKTISLTSTSASSMNKKYSSQPDEENLDSREKQLKYK